LDITAFREPPLHDKFLFEGAKFMPTKYPVLKGFEASCQIIASRNRAIKSHLGKTKSAYVTLDTEGDLKEILKAFSRPIQLYIRRQMRPGLGHVVVNFEPVASEMDLESIEAKLQLEEPASILKTKNLMLLNLIF
jgi:hypothetical protein